MKTRARARLHPDAHLPDRRRCSGGASPLGARGRRAGADRRRPARAVLFRTRRRRGPSAPARPRRAPRAERAPHARRRARRARRGGAPRRRARGAEPPRRGGRRLPRGRPPLRVPLPDRPRHPRGLRGRGRLRAPPGRGARLPDPPARAGGARAPAPRALARRRDEPRRPAALLARPGGRGWRARPHDRAARGRGRRGGARRARAPRALPRPRAAGRPRRADRLERVRLRPGRPAARLPARGASLRPRPHRRRARHPPRPELHARVARRAVRARGAGRARAPAERLHPPRGLPPRHRRQAADRQAEALHLRAPRGGDRAAYRDDPARLAAYNLEDARLVLEILERTRLVELAVERSLSTGMQLDRVGAAIASVDSLYLRALRARGRVAPSVRAAESAGAGIVGGLVLDSRPGLYRNILVFDFKSLYPSIIRTFNIDPLTYVPSPGAEPVIRTPGGAAFRREEPGILPELVARLGLERARARAAGNAIAAQATKILMNSLFGVLGSPASRLFSPAVANAITTAGQHVIRLAAAAVADLGHLVIYGDTDSLFVDLGEPDAARAAARGEELRAAIGGAVGAAVARGVGCTSHLALGFGTDYARFFMPEVRGGAMGSKKRYAGLVVGESGEEIEFVGLEAVRRDWSGVARRFQRVLLDLVFHDRPVADFIRGFVADLRAGRFDGELAYRKAIRKPLAEYTKTTPPHVKAARKQAGATGRIVTYVVTRSGPEAVGETTAPPDYDHYVAQQLRPIADAVLRFLGGPDFDGLTGARRQLTLFS